MNIAYIGLGSNLENPLQQVKSALQQLTKIPQTTLESTSHFYGSNAVGPGQQPDYVNAAACLHTQLDAIPLLDALQAIEQQHGRVRGPEQWVPRTLDLDLLLFNEDIINHPRLQVPHPRIAERNFVLQPLLDMDSNLALPNGPGLNSLLQSLKSEGLWRLPSTE